MIQLALLQFNPQLRSVEANLAYIIERTSSLRDTLVALPEFFLSSYYDYECIEAKELENILRPLLQLCRTNKLAFVGSLPIIKNGQSFNRGLYITDDKILHKDKTYLFGNEIGRFTPGKRNPLFRYKHIQFSIQVCLDIINPIPSYQAAQRGTRLIINPASVSVDFLRTINKARALENKVTTVFCNRSGSEKNGIQYSGMSRISLPDGGEYAVEAGEALNAVVLD